MIGEINSILSFSRGIGRVNERTRERIIYHIKLINASYSDVIDAITAAQNDSLDQYSAAGGIATEV